VAGDDGGSEDLVSPDTDEHLDEALVLAVQDGSVHGSQFLREGPERDATLPSLMLVEADVGDLRVGVGTPGDGQGAGPGAPLEQGVLQHDARHGISGVRELETRADITGGVDVRVGGLQPVVDGNPVPLVMAHADLVEIEAPHVGHPAGADQDLIDDHLLFRAAGEVNDLLVAPLLDAVDVAIQGEPHTVPP
jgi:hypothetical protein